MKDEDIGFFLSMCNPKKDQALNIHTEDVKYLVPLLESELPKTIIEIGAYYGTSSKLLAFFAKKNNGHLYSIDPNPYSEWNDNMKEYGLDLVSTLIPKTSPWIPWNNNQDIDLLFINGSRTFRSVLVDYFYWEKYVKYGGLIVFYGTTAPAATQRAVDEIMKTEYLEYVGQSKSRVGLSVYRKVKDKRGKTVFFGPWVGEFGFEVTWWQGYCRKIAKEYDYSIVSTYPGSEGLYSDFADEIIPHNLVGQPVCGFANGLTGDFDYPNVIKIIAPLDKKFIPHSEQEYIKFGHKNINHTYDIMIHINEHKRKQYKYWNDLLTYFNKQNLKCACFGKRGNHPDGYLDGTDDLRDMELGNLSEYLAGAGVVIGPCSGVMHFASYCCSRIVVWCDNKTYTWGQTLRQRFETILNPFNSPVIVLDKYDWNPEPKIVIDAVSQLLPT